MEIFGKTLKEYLWPVKYYVLVSVLVVVSQYYVAAPLSDRYPFLLNLTQALWVLMVALAVMELVKKHDFNMKNVIVAGILFSIIIHGLKAFFFRVFLFPYNIPAEQVPAQLMGKFLYGSFLVMATAIIIGAVFIYAKKKKLL
ncbi:MAG: hypothetical protein J4400_03220 [Candidatus Aenigmarchaeota archaeon]|nr:hypothetical protein [Candidatus Aenigmarchaeota archaeon]